MKKPIVFDIETQKTFDEVGRKNLHLLKVSVVGVYRYDTGAYEVYEESRLHELETLFQNASLLIGFNIRRFDMPVLQPYFFISAADLPMLDLMEDLERELGFRIGLDSLAKSTLGAGKSGSGLDAVRYFREGNMEALKKYCLDDVKITREVYEYGCNNGKVWVTTKQSPEKKEIPVNWVARQAV